MINATAPFVTRVNTCDDGIEVNPWNGSVAVKFGDHGGTEHIAYLNSDAHPYVGSHSPIETIEQVERVLSTIQYLRAPGQDIFVVEDDSEVESDLDSPVFWIFVARCDALEA